MTADFGRSELLRNRRVIGRLVAETPVTAEDWASGEIRLADVAQIS